MSDTQENPPATQPEVTETTDAAVNGDATPTEPLKELKKVAQPDDKGHKKNMARISAQVSSCHDKLNNIKAKLDALDSVKERQKTERQVHTSKLKEMKDALHALFDKKNTVRATLTAIKDKSRKLQDDVAAKRKTQPGKFRNAKEIDDEIAKLAFDMETTTMTLADEQNKVREINALKSYKLQAGEFEKVQEQIDTGKAQSTAIIGELQELDAEVTKLKGQIAKEEKKLDALSEKHREERGEVKTWLKERDDIRKSLNKLLEERRSVIEAHDTQYKEWKVYRKELGKRKAVERQKMDEEYANMKEEQRKERAAEFAHIHPWADEMAQCDLAINFLKSVLPKDAAAANGTHDDEKVEFETKANEQVIGKGFKDNDDDFINLGAGGGKKKGKKPKKKAGPAASSLNLSVDMIALYHELGMTPPSSMAQVPESLAAMEAKKSEFQGKDAAAKEAHTAAQAQNKAKKQGAKPAAAPAHADSKKYKGKDVPGPKETEAPQVLAGAWASRGK